jgi:uncharacterized membrane protein
MPIRHPIEWGLHQMQFTSADGPPLVRITDVPAVRRIDFRDIRDALSQGMADFVACRTDVLFLCVLYPVVGVMLCRLAFGYGILPLLFPLIAGFALLGPLVGVGLNEISRRRETGASVGWMDAFGVLRAPAVGSVAVLGGVLLGIFVLWLVAAEVIYRVTLGPRLPVSVAAFVHNVLTTPPGLALVVIGMVVGFVFAAAVLAMTVVAFPLMLDRGADAETAVITSLRVVRTNPGPVAVWGLIVAAGMVLGSLPALIGLAVVLPILGHAAWHLYRKLI